MLRIRGTCGDHQEEFQVAIRKAAQKKHRFQIGMAVSGMAVQVPDPQLETAEYYKASGFKVLKDAEVETNAAPPFHGVPTTLESYQDRGHFRLSSRTYDKIRDKTVNDRSTKFKNIGRLVSQSFTTPLLGALLIL